MPTGLVKTGADFRTTLALGVSAGDTTATLSSITNTEGDTLSNGTYSFTIDRKNSSKEHIVATVTGTALTSIVNVSAKDGTETSGFANAHRKGAEVIISDWVAIKRIQDVLETGYAAATTPSTDYQLATKKYVDDASFAGGTNASTTTPGFVELPTQAEVDAGDDTGGTGPTVVVPSMLRAKLYHDYAADSVGTDSYAIDVTPSITAYTTGQVFTFKAGTANTGACTLNVDGLGAKTIKKNGSEDLITGDIVANQICVVVYDGTNMQLVSANYLPTTTQGDVIYYNGSANVRLAKGTAGQYLQMNSDATAPTWNNAVYQQEIIFDVTSFNIRGVGSSSDGSVLYIIDSSKVINIFQKDPSSGLYVFSANKSTTGLGDQNMGVVTIGNYLYIFTEDNTNIICKRYDAITCDNETSMIVPSVACANQSIVAWTDGTDAYLVSGSSNTTSRRWTLSGTTFSAASTATVSGIEGNKCSVWDGTNAYIIEEDATKITITKLTNIDGSSKSSTNKTIPRRTTSDIGAIGCVGNSSCLYIGRPYAFMDEVGQEAVELKLFPVTKP